MGKVMLSLLLAQAASPAGAALNGCAGQTAAGALQTQNHAAKRVAVEVQLRLFKTRNFVEYAHTQAILQSGSAGSARELRTVSAIQDALAELKQA